MNTQISDDQISSVLAMFEIKDWQYEGFKPEKCPACGCRAAVYSNLYNVCACTNPHCENSLFGKKRKENLCWRTNEAKAVHDWLIYIGCEFKEGFYTLPGGEKK